MVSRRTFLAAGAAVSSTPKTQRDKPLRADYWGTQYYDEKERQEVLEVLETRRPFRWYGTGGEQPRKVLTFEKEFAARMQTKYALAVTSGTAALFALLHAGFRILSRPLRRKVLARSIVKTCTQRQQCCSYPPCSP